MDKLSSRFNLTNINKGLGQIRQVVSEKLGTAEEITDLPAEYKDLERRVDALRTLHTNLLHVTRTYTNSSYDYPNQLQESVVELSRSVGGYLKQVPTERTKSTTEFSDSSSTTTSQTFSSSSSQQSKTLPHALSRAASQGAQLFGNEEQLGIALSKFAIMQERIGEQRVKMDREITKKFVEPFSTTLNTDLQYAMKARKHVRSTRLALDTIKAKYKPTQPELSDAAKLEIEQAEDQFVAAVEEATTLMKSVLDKVNLVNAQLAFYKEAYETLAVLAPEIDDIHVTQERLYRNSHND
ncbi:12909_t:CDS:2 [Entrophospora sp. SA101]|nr:12909_t:CDS:2 [Entrophospora sp. SA101]CAJ0836661.1 17771_t:CDS:2 [Entrophospora sp. SA101]